MLDIGTGTGLWAVHLGDDCPGAAGIVGNNDLSPIQPSWCPPNVRFIVDDVELDWVEPEPFDLIHCRYMAGAIKRWPRLVRHMYENLKPGGWLELQESANTLYSQDGSLAKDNEVVQLMEGLMEACAKIGRTLDSAPSMERWVREAGFVNVKMETCKLPVGSWPKDPRLKEIVTLLGVNFTEGVEAFTAAMCADVLGWSGQFSLELLERALSADMFFAVSSLKILPSAINRPSLESNQALYKVTVAAFFCGVAVSVF